MKNFILLIFLVSMALTVTAQQKVTDREFEGFRGNVKSVLEETQLLVYTGGKVAFELSEKRTEYLFEKGGRIDQITYFELNGISKFKIIDGSKTHKNEKIKEIKSSNILVLKGEPAVQQPIELPEKLVPPDKRFNVKYIYEYYPNGKVKTERQYFNDEKLYKKAKFFYDKNGFLTKENVKFSEDFRNVTYKYDDKGNLVEEISDMRQFGDLKISKTTYSDYKVDSQGNWLQSKHTLYHNLGTGEIPAERMHYRTIVYY